MCCHTCLKIKRKDEGRRKGLDLKVFGMEEGKTIRYIVRLSVIIVHKRTYGKVERKEPYLTFFMPTVGNDW